MEDADSGSADQLSQPLDSDEAQSIAEAEDQHEASRSRGAGYPAAATLAMALGLGLLGDLLLRAYPWGVNALLWVSALSGALLALARWRGLRLSGGGRWMLLPGLAFAAALIWRDSPTLISLNLLALLVSFGLLALRGRAGWLHNAGVVEYVRGLVVVSFGSFIGFMSMVMREVDWRRLIPFARSPQARATIRGLLIALPLLLIFGTLFISADAAFEDLAFGLFDWDVGNLLEHSVLIGCWAWLAGGFLRQTLHPGTQAAWRPPDSPWRLGAIELGIVLGSLNALFLAFVLVQLRYFFGGAALVQSSAELTYAQYARRGFFELVTVAALALPLLLLAHWMQGEQRAVGKLFRTLAGSLIALLFVIMASAIQRMLLYQQAFGLTELRLYTSAFMLWLALVFLWFIATVLRERRERFAFGALLAGFAMILALNALNPDALIVSTNLQRTQSVEPFDARYASQLSADAVPQLLSALPQLPQEQSCVIAAQILTDWGYPQQDWRSWNWSRSTAREQAVLQREQLEQIACELR